MKLFLLSSATAIVIALVAYFALTSLGMDTASVLAGADVRL